MLFEANLYIGDVLLKLNIIRLSNKHICIFVILLADNLAPAIKNEQCFSARFFILQAICTSNYTSTLKVLTIAAESSLERRFRHTKDFPFLIACIKYRIGDLNILNITLTLTSTKWKKRSSLGQHVTHILA